MTFYHSEIIRIRELCYSNTHQLQTVIGTKNYIDQHFDQELNLDMLSHIRYTSKFHLLRLFKRYYGLSPRQYMTDRRIEQSKHYLRRGMSVSESCFAVGFESPASFSTLFRRKTAWRPGSFKKEQFSQSDLRPDSGSCIL